MRIVTASVLPLLFVAFSCGSDSPVSSLDGIKAKNSKVSFCGGFDAATKAARNGKITAAADTTAGETLTWTYDRVARTATFLHERVSLNCCGERTIAAYPENNRLVIAETDAPGSGGRCKCMCNYDFYTEIGGLSSRSMDVVLQIAIDGVLEKRWTGTINLAAGNGTIAIPKAD